MADKSLAFKQYQRNSRVQLTEEIFNKGMNYVENPLQDGSVKLMLNYDLRNSGSSLVPRAGYKVETVSNFLEDAGLSPASSISHTKAVVEADSSENGLILVGNVTEAPVGNTTLYRGTTSLLHYKDGTVKNIKNEKTHSYIRAKDTEIHGMPVQDTPHAGSLVGCYGFNNNFYAFKNDGEESCITHTAYNQDNKSYEWKDLIPKTLTPKEAVSWGYNMLLDNPYSFANAEAVGTITLLGLMPYDINNNLIMTPVVNQDLYLHLFYAAPKNTEYQVLMEYRDPVASSWTELADVSLNTGADLKPFVFRFSSPMEDVIIRCTVLTKVVGETNPDGSQRFDVLQTLAVGFSMSKDSYGTTANVAPKNYTISKARGLAYWKQRLIAYGVPEDPTILFFGDVNDPTYFPFPNNAEILEEPIIYVLPFLENLLVFTTTKLYIFTLDLEGSWTFKLIQSNLNIKPYDLHLIQVVKNMVFFKSGNYYYMVVPKAASVTGELTIAPISKPIEEFFDNFEESVKDLLFTVYNYEEELTLVKYYNYLDYEDINNIYVFKAGSLFINFNLLYNSVGRYWRCYVYETDQILSPYKQDATKSGTLVALAEDNGKVGLQFITRDKDNPKDQFYKYETTLFNNYQLLDTGYRDQSTDFKKRYREVQFKLNNIAQKKLTFFTEFIIDGVPRKTYEKYLPILGPDGIITYERYYTDALVIPNTTVLGNGLEDHAGWTLDTSEFPETKSWKSRLPVSGKGYTPRLIIISHNDEAYELLSFTWVYRMMNSR